MLISSTMPVGVFGASLTQNLLNPFGSGITPVRALPSLSYFDDDVLVSVPTGKIINPVLKALVRLTAGITGLFSVYFFTKIRV